MWVGSAELESWENNETGELLDLRQVVLDHQSRTIRLASWVWQTRPGWPGRAAWTEQGLVRLPTEPAASETCISSIQGGVNLSAEESRNLVASGLLCRLAGLQACRHAAGW